MDAQIYQEGHKEPLDVEKLKQIEYFSVTKDGLQILNDDFSKFSLNNVVSEVKFVGKTETVVIRAEKIESIKFDESFI